MGKAFRIIFRIEKDGNNVRAEVIYIEELNNHYSYAMGNVFDNAGNELRTPVAFHPGEFLLEEVEERGLKKTEFAKSIGLLPGNLSELFKGKRHITARMAVRLEKALGISAEYWIGLQSAYDLIIARALESV